MTKIPVKLTKGEIVVSPQVYQQYKDRIEAMNKEGLLARNMGGVAAYRASGGAVYRQEGGETSSQGLGGWASDNSRGLGKIGASLVAIGQNDFKGASAALTPDKVDRKGAEKIKDQLDLFTRYAKSAAKALAYVDTAGPALNQLSNATAIADAGYAASAVLPVINQGTAALNQVREAAINKTMREWGDKPENVANYRDYKLLEAAVTELTTTALKAQGPGPKTDFDFIVAARSTADLTATPSVIKESLRRLLVNANEEIVALGGTPIKEMNKADADQADTTETPPKEPDLPNSLTTNSLIADHEGYEPENDPLNEDFVEPEDTTDDFSELEFSETLQGLEGKWAEVDEDKVPVDVKDLGDRNKNRTIIDDETGRVFIRHDAGILFRARWYVREGLHNG